MPTAADIGRRTFLAGTGAILLAAPSPPRGKVCDCVGGITMAGIHGSR